MTEFIVALVVTALAVAALLPVLGRAQLLDVPNARSSHDSPIPRGGGIAVAAGIGAAVAVNGVGGGAILWPVLAAGLALAIVGFVDDLHTMGSSVRLLIQLVTGLALAAWAASAHGSAGLPVGLFVPIAAVGVAGYVNAFNFMDGINGISALNAAVAGGWFAWAGAEYDVRGVAVTGLAVAGAAIGFLPWNAPRAHIFLGDVGSYSLGVVVSGLAVTCWAKGVPAVIAVAPLVVYLADTMWVLVKRGTGGRPLTVAHREHVYQRLVDNGWSHLSAATLTAVAGVLMAGAVWLYWDHLPVVAVIVVSVLALAYLAAPTVHSRVRDAGGTRP